MALPLLIAIPDVVRARALALVRLPNGAETYRTVTVAYVRDTFAKASEHGKVYSDGDGSYRWITVHPHGDDSKGTPVKIRESKTQKGVWHVVGGAGGNLNYLKLHLGTVEEQKERAAAKAEAKKLRAKNQRELERERKADLSEEERKAEAEAAREQKRQQAAARDELRTRQHEQIAAVATHLGWKDDEWKFDATRERLKASGASAERIQQQEADHHKRVYARVQDALAQTKRALLADRERAAGGVPLTTTDEDTVALTDLLEGPTTPKGKGYKAITKDASDHAIRAALAESDADALAAELHAAEDALTGDPTESPDAAARVADLRAQLHTVQLIAKAETMTEGEIEQRRQDVSQALAAAQSSQDAYRPRLTALREKLRATDGKGLDLAETAELESLELQQAEDLRHVQRLKAETLDLAVMAGETVKPAVAGEQKRVAAAKQADREAAIRAEHGESGVESYRAMIAKLRAGTEKYQAEMEHYRATGALRRPELAAKPIVDADAALQLLAKQKAIAKMERQLAGDKEDLDLRMFGQGYFDAVGKATPEMIAEVERDIENGVREQKTRAFLARADSPDLLLGRGGRFSDDHDERTLHQALERHLSAGAYNALNNAALAGVKAPILSREVVDTLGSVGAAQLLAHALAQQETPATLRAMAKGLGAYHVEANVDHAEERLREVDEALDQADEAIAHLTNPADVGVALEANQRRQAKLEEARQTLGQALGEYEATAALVKALGSKPPTEIETNLGPIGTETAIRQLRALGLDREDYAITSDGTNYIATIKASGFSKLAAPVDHERAALQDEVLAIKRGARDEPDWQPPGTIKRAATTFTAPGKEPPPLRVTPLGDALANAGQGGLFGGGGGDVDVAATVREHIAKRAANGEDPNTLLADLHARMLEVPADHRQAVSAEVNRIFPLMQPLVERGKPVYRTGPDGKALLGEDGKPIPKMVPTKAETHADTLRQLTRDELAKAGLDRSADLHSQTIDLHHPKTREALTRALAEDPRALVAFKAPGELTHQDQRVLRHAFATDLAKREASTGLDAKALEAKLAALGPEPAPQRDMFSGTETPTAEGLEWRRQRDALVAEAQQGRDGQETTSWSDYVAVMGGTRNAYQALQDHLKSRALKSFHQAYTVLHDQPLRVGTRSIAHAERHAGYLDPAKRAQLLAQRAKLLDEARNRVAGQYAAGSATEKMGRIAQADEIARQNQMGLLGATPAAATRKAPEAHERYTLGDTVEGQLASLMPSMARAFDPAKPVPLLKDVSWQGAQERFIKIGLASKRVAGAMGVGSGKTGAAIGLFTAARADPGRHVSRALYLVPSAVQGQFGAEFARFVEPGTLNWSANTGASRTERLAEHADRDTHAVVHTHEAARDDFLHLLGKHWGVDGDAVRDKLMSLDRKTAAAEMKSALKAAGVRYDMLITDEAHKLLDRNGKPDSVLSRVVQALGDVTQYYASMSVSGDMSVLVRLNGKVERLTMAELSDRIGLDVNEIRSGLAGLEVRACDIDTGTMRWSPVTAMHKYDGSEKRCYEIIGAYQKRLVVTEDHSCYVWRDGAIRCVRGDEVRITDQLVIETKIDSEEGAPTPSVSGGVDLSAIAYLIGLYVGDGCLASDRNAIVLSLGAHEVEPILTKLRGDIPELRTQVTRRGREGVVRIYSDPIVALFRQWFGGQKAHTKRLPAEILSASLAVQAQVIRGYEDSDGYRGRDQTSIGSCNRPLLEDVGVLLSRHGIPWAIHRGTPPKSDGARGFGNGGPAFFLRYTPNPGTGRRRPNRSGQVGVWRDKGRYRSRVTIARTIHDLGSFATAAEAAAARESFFREHCGVTAKDGPNRPLTPLSDSAARIPIRSIREVREAYVYDISVAGLANFIANGVLTHNSADPVKNDISELRSLLDKLHPDGRYADSAAFQRRYGVNTTASAEALKREIAPSVYAASVPTGNQVTRRHDVVPMHPKQAEQYANVMGAFEKLRSARARGVVDVEAARVLAPERFADAPESEHQAIARTIQKNPGGLKEEALRRVIDEAPREHNAKIQHLLTTLKEHPVKDKPVVVFAHRLKAVDEITEALAEQGHRVQALTGADSADVRDAKRRRFQDTKDVDVFVLSDAGEAGLNLQRGSMLVNYDTPLTAKTFEQRNGRIDRRGREDPNVELLHLATDSPFEARAHARLTAKGELRQILTDPAEMIDDTGVAKVFSDARRAAAQDASMRRAS